MADEFIVRHLRFKSGFRRLVLMTLGPRLFAVLFFAPFLRRRFPHCPRPARSGTIMPSYEKNAPLSRQPRSRGIKL